MTNAATAPAPTAPAHLANAMHLLRFSRGATMKMFEGVPESKYAAGSDAVPNHGLWTLGHLATTDDWFANEFGKVPSGVPASWNDLFGMKSKPLPDASKYPSIAEVKRALEDRRAAVEKWILSLTPAQLAAKTADNWQSFAPTMADVLYFISWHEGYHTGQLAPFRRGIGLGPAFG